MFRREQRAVSGNAACCIGQRGVLCGATQRAVWVNAPCCELPQGVCSFIVAHNSQK